MKKLGMSKKEVEYYLSALIMEKFFKWISGQTCPLIKGKTHYYEHDVRRFADMILEGKPTYFD